MSPGREDRSSHDDDYEEVSRSIFSATWFRALLVFIALAVIAVVALPYALEWANPPAQAPVVSRAPVPIAPPSQPSPPPGQPPSAIPVPPPSVATPAPAMPATPAPPATPPPAMTEPPKPLPGAQPVQPGTGRPTDPAGIVAAAPSATDRRDPTRPAMPLKRAAVKSTTSTPSTARAYWVQTGAFRDLETARRMVAKLRGENFPVAEPVTAGAAAPARAATESDRYEVFVSGTAASEVTAKLAGKNFTAQPVAGGAVISPSLSLAEAVALSKDLGADGLRVQVRRATTGATAAGGAEATGDVIYRVRVGAFADRASAETALRELESRGYKAFIARGGS
jgi:hypothetical protein